MHLAKEEKNKTKKRWTGEGLLVHRRVLKAKVGNVVHHLNSKYCQF